VSFDVETDLPLVPVDADRVQQVTLNLLTNALRATERGGWVRVTLRGEPRLEDASAARRAIGPSLQRVQLVVADSGCGIPPSVLPRLFEPFFTTAASEGGAGLGLAVVRSIVLEHGGEIAVESTEGHGSVFTVTLPMLAAPLRAAVGAPNHAAAPTGAEGAA
jgi:signal transduction histidine kinase